MGWKRLRFALALLGLGMAATPGIAFADEGCPWIIYLPECGHGMGPQTCGNSGGVECSSCTYWCHGTSYQHTWNMCET